MIQLQLGFVLQIGATLPQYKKRIQKPPAPASARPHNILMSQTSPETTIQTSVSTARPRLVEYLARRLPNVGEAKLNGKIVHLTPDASTREYFRIPWERKKTAVAAVYPEAFDPQVHPFLDITRLFAEARLPVPEILDVEPQHGIIVQEDLGDKQLRQVYETASDEQQEEYLERAIGLIARIQAATEMAHAANSIASRLAFDEAKLIWELEFFVQHFFGSFLGTELKHGEQATLKAELNDLAAELAARPRTLCHRDYHTANLVVDKAGELRIVDHQDARMGPASYDLVSLLLDRQSVVPSLAQLREHRLLFLEERRNSNLPAIDPDDFAREFRLMTVQRGLKAVGTFSYQTAVCGRGEMYKQYIRPTFLIVQQAAEWLNRFPKLRAMIHTHLKDEKLK
ncbi:MAG: phosphotransferase [Pyrinomonadaceae bacterium]|nr:phosphotransferase [Pyrinomonadaceae bacterium]